MTPIKLKTSEQSSNYVKFYHHLTRKPSPPPVKDSFFMRLTHAEKTSYPLIRRPNPCTQPFDIGAVLAQ